jgi:hypothetical protein
MFVSFVVRVSAELEDTADVAARGEVGERGAPGSTF